MTLHIEQSRRSQAARFDTIRIARPRIGKRNRVLNRSALPRPNVAREQANE